MPRGRRQDVEIGRIRMLIGNREYGQAISECVRAIERDPGADEHFHLLAVASEKAGRFSEAIVLFEEAARRLPDRADVAFNHGVALMASGDGERAAAQWRRALALDPGHQGALFNLGRAAAANGATDEAEASYRRLIAESPRHVDGLYNLGNLLFRTGRRAEAATLFETVTVASPGHSDAWANLSLCRLRLGDTEGAVAAGETSTRLGPDRPIGHVNLAYALLKNRRLAEGFAELEWRRVLQPPPFPGDPGKAWTSGELRGKRLVVFAEQGQGDAIHFFRYVKAAAALGNEVTLLVHPSLERLAARVEGTARALPFGAHLPPFDASAPLMSVPHLTGCNTLAGIPPSPYLGSAAGSRRHSGVKRVGIVWRGNPGYDDDAARSCPLAEFRPLLSMPGIRWVGLQLRGRSEIESEGLSGLIEDATGAVADFHDTAAIVRSLDLVVGVDTAVIHLAGALGVPAYLMLPFVSDWRWFDDPSRTPWYESMRLFRQRVPGDWAGVVGRLTAAIVEL